MGGVLSAVGANLTDRLIIFIFVRKLLEYNSQLYRKKSRLHYDIIGAPTRLLETH